MKYIAINTAAQTEILLSLDKSHYFSSPDKTLASIELLPHINMMLKNANTRLDELDFFSCVTGPGSFTGTRIAVSTIRAFAYALKKPVLPVIYFDILAYNNKRPFAVAIDGGAGVAYLKTYGASGESDTIVIKTKDIPVYAAGLEVVSDSIFTPEVTKLAQRGAESLAAAVENALKVNGLTDFDKLVPLYLRKSQPERGAGEL